MDPRMESMVDAFLEEKDLTYRVYVNDMVSVQVGDRRPWTIEFMLKEKGGYIFTTFPVSGAATRAPAVRKACRAVEQACGMHCYRDEDGDVVAAEKLSDEIPDEIFGQYCLNKLRKFDHTLETVVFPQLVFALESSLADRLFLRLTKAYYHAEDLPIHLTDWKTSALYRKMMRRRFAEEIRRLGVIDMTDCPISTGVPAEQHSAGGKEKAPSRRTAAGKRPQKKAHRQKEEGEERQAPVLLYMTLAAFTVQMFFLQILWALSRYGLEDPYLFGVRREFLVYAALAVWLGILVPPLMRRKRWIAANGILVLSALFYTGFVLLLNNLWHCMEYLRFFASAWDRYGPGSLIAAFWQLLGQDLRYSEGMAIYRYPAVFLIAMFAIAAGYGFRFALRPRLRAALSGSRENAVVLRQHR